MKTLADGQCKNEISERVGRVQADSQRHWGKMSAHQMVCHLADSLRCPLGEKTAGEAKLTVSSPGLEAASVTLPVR